MKKFVIIFFVALGLAIGVQDVRAQNTQNADLHPPYLAEEEPAVPEGEEVPVLEEGEEGEITERGIRRFKFKKQSRPGIIFPQKPGPGTKKFRLKRRPVSPPSGSSNQPPRGGGAPPVEPPDPIKPPDQVDSTPQCVWHTSDIIDQRIDISAQQRLMHMMSQGGDERIDASAMIGAVKQGALAGILLAPRKAVSDRGQRMTPPKGWWELIPQGQLGTCLQEPLGDPPMMLYRDKMGETNLDPSVIDHTLRTMWGQCGLPTPAPACSYLVDLHKPSPPPGSPDEQPEGHGLSEVMVNGGGQPLSGVGVIVHGSLKIFPEGHPRENEKGPPFILSNTTNVEGIATFVLPPLQRGIRVDVIGPPGFLGASFAVGGFILDKRLMIELSPTEGPAS